VSVPTPPTGGVFTAADSRVKELESEVERLRSGAERERERADDHDSARQSEKERADYAEAQLAEARAASQEKKL